MHFLMPSVFSSHTDFKEWFSNPLTGMVEGSQEYSETIVRRLHKVGRRGGGGEGRRRREWRKRRGGGKRWGGGEGREGGWEGEEWRGERKGKVGSGRSILAVRSVKEGFEEMEYALT